MSDLEFQAAFVVQAVPRMLAQMDRDPLSPTHGCAHPAYWRDKTSELADMRRQEAMLPLLWLYLHPFPASTWQGRAELLHAVQSLLGFWIRQRYPDGSMDEWYPGERAFAAAAFTVHAVARTLHDGAGVLPPTLLREGRVALAQSAHWLTRRDDLFKSNHQAVGVAALAWAGKVLGDPALTANARHKMGLLLATQTGEGWFPEVGHMDVGYTFLTVEYLAMALDLWEEWTTLPALLRAFEFASAWVHPDLSVGEEYGVCHNPYLSSIAILYLSSHAPLAVWMRQRLEQGGRGFHGLAHTLADDLRLMRWGFQPLLAWQLRERFPMHGGVPPRPIPLADPLTETAIHASSSTGLARLCAAGGMALCAPVAGGLLRLFPANGGTPWTDFGYGVKLEQGFATHLTYDRGLAWRVEGNRLVLRAPLTPVQKFMPSFLSRLVLRLACTTALGSRLARQGIDIIRKRKGTALNQSSANLRAGRSPWWLERRVTLSIRGLAVTDHLAFDRPLALGQIFLLAGAGTHLPAPDPLTRTQPHLKGAATSLWIHKQYVHGEDGWVCAEIRADLHPPAGE